MMKLKPQSADEALRFVRPIQSTCMIVGAYVLLGSTWILVSDLLLEDLVSERGFRLWSILKGWVFVLVTAVLLTIILVSRERARSRSRNSLLKLVEFVQRLAGTRSERDLLATIPTAARSLIAADGATLVMVEGCEYNYVSEDAKHPFLEGRRLPLSQGVTGWVIQNRLPASVGNIHKDTRVWQPFYEGSSVKSLVMVPILHEEAIGAIGVYWNRKHQPSARELLLLSTLADAAASAFEDVRAYSTMEAQIARRTERLKEALEQAQSADRLKSAFLATMSHELRTPLNSIIGFVGIILQGLAGPLTAEQSKQLKMVRGSSRHLLALINDVLDISKIEAGQLGLTSQPYDLMVSLQRALDTILPMAGGKGLLLSSEFPDGPVLQQLVGDRRRVEQVLINLLQNAVKFTEQGSIVLRLRHDPANVSIEVEDTGIGISADDQILLFQPFSQLEGPLTRRQQGTGLGLAISQRLAGLMGGRIHLFSEPGRGSRFTLILPITT